MPQGRPQLFPACRMSVPLKTIVYVDGFNFYYGAVRKTPYKWLDIPAMCQKLLPRHEIVKTKYFTARVAARPSDPDQPNRQQTYLRALQTLPNIEVIYGHFLTNRVRMPVANCPPNAQRYEWVIKTEEKGSDVNLATHLVADAFRRRFEAAVLITNDSDLTEAVRIVKQELGLVVGILNPHQHPSRELLKNASFMKPIRTGVLASSQLASPLHDGAGEIRKPGSW
ncbi:MAG: NYN domain-containing protein [Gemmatimonadota bacterium]